MDRMDDSSIPHTMSLWRRNDIKICLGHLRASPGHKVVISRLAYTAFVPVEGGITHTNPTIITLSGIGAYFIAQTLLTASACAITEVVRFTAPAAEIITEPQCVQLAIPGNVRATGALASVVITHADCGSKCSALAVCKPGIWLTFKWCFQHKKKIITMSLWRAHCDYIHHGPGLCIITAIWRPCNAFSQWQQPHWLKVCDNVILIQ